MTELESLEQELLKPSEALISDISKIEGDIIILGVGGKMGPSMAKLARNPFRLINICVFDIQLYV